MRIALHTADGIFLNSWKLKNRSGSGSFGRGCVGGGGDGEDGHGSKLMTAATTATTATTGNEGAWEEGVCCCCG